MDQWAQIFHRLDEWTSPLRPSLEDISLYKKYLNPGAKVLLLGVTPELMPFANIAIDNNPKLIVLHGPKAVLGDWNDLPFDQEFDAVIGDGCLTVFQGTPARFFEQIRKVVKKGGSITLRLFVSPEKKESYDEVLNAKNLMGFHAFKWRVAHTLADPYIPVKELYKAIFPIWPHPTLEVYRESDLIYYFPKLSELPPASHINVPSSYELADRCPIVTWNI